MRRVLLVDDEVHVLSALQRIMRPFLQEYEIEIEAFCDPEQALLRCADTSFDIVMSDYRMPGLTGADFLQMVKGIQPDAVRLMLSASTEFAEVSNAINRAEVFRYVAKPWDGDELKKIFLLAFERHDEALRTRPQSPMSAQEQEAHRLEVEEPGITQVRRDPDGSVYLD
ncbi:MAG: signal transduction response regulator receiver domain protein [Massilia sp.]|jgi:two-component system probable response regulator PhcQ|nr:signal transduction response regulator receiver domain protein [Massilia sp.]